MDLSIIQSPAHIEISLQAAMETIVLLKNDETKGLPLGQVDKACVSRLHQWYNTHIVLYR